MKSVFLLLFSLYSYTTFAQTAHRDVPYANDTLLRHRMDIHIPANANGALPCVIWIHGGGWRSGSKGNISTLSNLLSNGYVIADINYRLSGDSLFPAQIYDCKAAVRFLKANADSFNIDTCKIGAAGSSAGGHLATLLGTSAGVAALEDMSLGNSGHSSRIYAVLDLYGPTDFMVMDSHVPATPPDSCTNPMVHDTPNSPESKLLGCMISSCPALVQQANPITYLSPDDAPFMIRHGTFDCSVAPYNSTLLHNKLDTLGIYNDYYLIPHAGHGGPDFKRPVIKAEYQQFFDSFLKNRVCDTSGNDTATTIGGLTTNSISVYPNPATHTVTVKVTGDKHQITIRSILGKTMYWGKDEHIDISHFTPGLYSVIITTGTQTNAVILMKE